MTKPETTTIIDEAVLLCQEQGLDFYKLQKDHQYFWIREAFKRRDT